MLNRRPAPVVDALLALLQQDTLGLGITTTELANRMNKSTATIASKLGRMRAYGLVSKNPENRNGRHPLELIRWRIREAAGLAGS